MATLSKFPIYSLPIIVVHTVLRQLSFFEFVSLSCVSNTSKKICRSVWTQSSSLKSRDCFEVLFSNRSHIRLKLGIYAKWPEWVIKFDTIPQSLQTMQYALPNSALFSSSFRKQSCLMIETKQKSEHEQIDGLHITEWKPTKKNVERYSLDPKLSSRETKEFTIQAFTSGNRFSVIKAFVDHLSVIYNTSLQTAALDVQNLQHHELEHVVKLFTDVDGRPEEIERVVLMGKKLPDNRDSLNFLMRSLKVGQQLDFDISLPIGFKLDFENIHSRVKYLEMEYSQCIGLDDLIEMDFDDIALCRSSLTDNDFRMLIEKWKSGWDPKFNTLMIESPEVLNLDSYICGPVTNITDHLDRSIIDSNPIPHSYKFKTLKLYSLQKSIGQRTLVKNGFNIVRDDRSVATVTVENERVGWFHIQPNNSQTQFDELPFNIRTFFIDMNVI